MRLLIFFLVLKSLRTECLTDPGEIFLKIRDQTLTVFYSTNNSEKFEQFLNEMLSNPRWTFEIFTEKCQPIPAQLVRKEKPRETVVIVLRDDQHFLKIVSIIRSKRILNHQTAIILITEFFADGLQEKLWENLRTGNVTVFSFEGKETLGKFGDFSPRNFTLKMLALRNDEPYVVNNNRGNGLDGVCIRLVRTIASAVGRNVEEILANEDPAETMYVPYNGSEFSGFLSSLYQQKLDIVCGSLTLYKPRYDAADVLPPMSMDNFYWFVGKNRQFHQWQTFLTEFTLSVWIAFFLTWLATSFVIYLHFRMAGISSTYLTNLLDLFGLFLENISQRLRGRFRTVCGIILLYSVVMNAGYKSGLLSKLTVPKPEKPLETPQAGMDKGFIYMSYNSTDFYLSVIGESNPNHKRLVRENRVLHFPTTFQLLDKILNNFTTLALLDENDAKSTIIRKFLTRGGMNAFYFLPNAYIMQRKNVYMSPGHPLTHVFAAIQDRLIEAGFVSHWFQQIYHDMAITAVGNFQQFHPTPIQLYHLSGLFYFLLLCLACCSLTFFAEILAFQLLKNKTRNVRLGCVMLR